MCFSLLVGCNCNFFFACEFPCSCCFQVWYHSFFFSIYKMCFSCCLFLTDFGTLSFRFIGASLPVIFLCLIRIINKKSLYRCILSMFSCCESCDGWSMFFSFFFYFGVIKGQYGEKTCFLIFWPLYTPPGLLYPVYFVFFV